MDVDHSEAIRIAAKESSQTVNEYLTNPSDRSAKVKALRDARNLVRELQDGDDAFFARNEHCTAAYALRFIMAIGAFEKIPKTGSIKAEQLAAEVGSEASLIVRMMRIIVAEGDIDEVAQDEYAHTRRSINLLDPGYGDFFEIIMDYMYPTYLKLPEYFKSHDLESPSSPTHNPYSWTYGMEGQDWIHVVGSTPGNLEKLGRAMGGKWATVPATGIYPFDTELASLSSAAVEQDRTFIVDVGGSQGGTLKKIREAYPSLSGRMIVQDMPQVIDSISAGFLPSELDIHPQAHDFWGPQQVQNAAVYYLRRILHDWPDGSCRTILRNIVDAMGPDSRLLIAEICVPSRVQKEDPYCYWMDMTVLTFAGKERNELEWRELFASVGLELVRVWKAAIGTQAVMEGRLKRV